MSDKAWIRIRIRILKDWSKAASRTHIWPLGGRRGDGGHGGRDRDRGQGLHLGRHTSQEQQGGEPSPLHRSFFYNFLFFVFGPEISLLVSPQIALEIYSITCQKGQALMIFYGIFSYLYVAETYLSLLLAQALLLQKLTCLWCCRSLHVFPVAEACMSFLLAQALLLQKLTCLWCCRSLHVFAVAEAYMSFVASSLQNLICPLLLQESLTSSSPLGWRKDWSTAWRAFSTTATQSLFTGRPSTLPASKSSW